MNSGVPEPHEKPDVFAYQLIVHGPTGQGWTFTKKFFSDPELVKEAAEADIGLITQMLQTGKILVQTPKGPQAAMGLVAFLALIGVSPPYVSAAGVSGTMQGKVMLATKPGILGPDGQPV